MQTSIYLSQAVSHLEVRCAIRGHFGPLICRYMYLPRTDLYSFCFGTIFCGNINRFYHIWFMHLYCGNLVWDIGTCTWSLWTASILPELSAHDTIMTGYYNTFSYFYNFSVLLIWVVHGKNFSAVFLEKYKKIFLIRCEIGQKTMNL